MGTGGAVVSGLVEFLRARYTEARKREESKRTIACNLPFEWSHVYDRDGEYVEIGWEKRRVSADEFFEQYGESAADPDVLADLDAKLRLLDWSDWPGGGPDCRDGYEWALVILAVPFAAHPDYDTERWRP
jgi:hypothetical protein